MSQLPLDLTPRDYRWRVQCTHHLVDRRTGEPYRWVLGCWSRLSAEALARHVERFHPGVRAVAELR